MEVMIISRTTHASFLGTERRAFLKRERARERAEAPVLRVWEPSWPRPELLARVAPPRQVAESPHTVGWTRMDSDGEPAPIPRGRSCPPQSQRPSPGPPAQPRVPGPLRTPTSPGSTSGRCTPFPSQLSVNCNYEMWDYLSSSPRSKTVE